MLVTQNQSTIMAKITVGLCLRNLIVSRKCCHKKDKILYFIHYRRCHIAFFIICFRVQRYEKFRNIIRFDEKNLSNIRISLFSHPIKQSEGQPFD